MSVLSKLYQNFFRLKKKVYLIRSVLTFKPFDVSTEDGRSKERYRRVVLTAGSSLISKSITVLTSLISVPLTLHYLGMERYGLWMTISSIMVFLSFADLGLGNGLLNAISRADGFDNKIEASIAVSSAFFILSGTAIFLYVIFWIAYPYIPFERIFNITSDIAIRESGPAIAIFLLTYLINIPLGIIERIRLGYQEGYKNQLWLSVGSILGLAGVLIAIYFKASLPWLVLAMAGGPLLATFVNGFYLLVFSRPYLFPRWKYFSLSISKSLLGMGMIFSALQFFYFFGNYPVDNIVIAQILGASAVTPYAVVQKLFLVTLLAQYFLMPLWPAFGEAMARREHAWVRRTLNRALILSLGLGVLIGLPLLVFGKRIVLIWVGPNVVPSTILLLGFTLWALLNCFIGSIGTFLNTGDLVKRQITFFGLASLVAFALKIVGAHYFQVEGVVWGTVVGYSLFYIIPAMRLAYGALELSSPLSLKF
jgi:O-antigen/teichoic acid export membrane protein